MMDAAQEYTSLVTGQTPDPEKHQTFIVLEPNTGNPLRGGKRVQFNMFLRKIDNIPVTDKLRTSLVPVVWVDEGIALNEEMVNVLKSELINVLKILTIVHWLLFAGGLGLTVFFGAWWYLTRNTGKMN